MTNAIDDLLTIPQAADALHVSVSTVRRWIRSGDLPAHRVGPKRLMVTRGELGSCIRSGLSERATPEGQASASADLRDEHANLGRPLISHTLSPAEQKRGLKALARLRRSLELQLAARGGIPYENSVEQLHEIREERYGGDH